MINDYYDDEGKYHSSENTFCDNCEFVIDGDNKIATCSICGDWQPLDNLSIDGKLK